MLSEWIAAEQPLAIFWDLTPALHASVMEGVNRRHRMQLKLDTALAWRIANFSRAEKLRNLSHYLKQLEDPKPSRPQTLEEMEAVFDRLVRLGKARVVQ